MICHPDRSAAEWRDLLFVRIRNHASRLWRFFQRQDTRIVYHLSLLKFLENELPNNYGFLKFQPDPPRNSTCLPTLGSESVSENPTFQAQRSVKPQRLSTAMKRGSMRKGSHLGSTGRKTRWTSWE